MNPNQEIFQLKPNVYWLVFPTQAIAQKAVAACRRHTSGGCSASYVLGFSPAQTQERAKHACVFWSHKFSCQVFYITPLSLFYVSSIVSEKYLCIVGECLGWIVADQNAAWSMELMEKLEPET